MLCNSALTSDYNRTYFRDLTNQDLANYYTFYTNSHSKRDMVTNNEQEHLFIENKFYRKKNVLGLR